MKPSEALRKARELITPEGAWMQRHLISADGDTGVRPGDPRANCFCSMGAILQLGLDDPDDVFDFLMLVIGEQASLVKFNDAPDRTHEDVLAAFDAAAAFAEEAGQ